MPTQKPAMDASKGEGIPTESQEKTKRRRRRSQKKPQKAKAEQDNEFSSLNNNTIKPLSIDEGTRWKATSVFRLAKTESSNSLRDARLVRWLLNKVTPSNFDTILMVFVAETKIHHKDKRTRESIETIIDRAAMDPRYASVYAQMCGRLAQDLSNHNGDESVPTCSFGDLLRQVCREEIQQDTRLDVVAEDFTRRRRYVGAKRFMEELYNHNVLSAKEMIGSLNSLLEQAIVSDSESVNELALEGLCVLLDTCGKLLDEPQSAPTSFQESSAQAEDLQRFWDVLTALLKSTARPALSFRIRSMILDLVELRQLNWHPVRFGARQRKELVPRALLVDVHVVPRGNRRRGKRAPQKKQVHFESKSASSRVE